MNKSIVLSIILAAFLSSCQPAHAGGSCETTADVAKLIMELRQAGVDEQRVLKVTQGEYISGAMVEMAYKTAQWSSERMRKQEIDGYGELWYAACEKY